MTIYKYLQPFIYKNESSDWHYSCVDRSSEYVVRVDECIRVCYWYFMGNGKLDKYGNYSSKKYKRLDKNGNIEIMDISPQGYENLLDNFNSYYGAVEDDETLTILSIGSSLTHRPRKDGGFNKETMSEGFGVVINKMTNDIVLVTLGEDDGNYWGDHELPYENLSVYDRNEIIRIVNDIDESHFWNKDKLIKKLWHYETRR